MYKIDEKVQVQRFNKMIYIKLVRETICKEFILDDLKLSKLIIKKYNLKRINNKYISKIRNYDESYYARKKLKEEEVVFAVKMLLFSSFKEQFDKLEEQNNEFTRLLKEKYQNDYENDYLLIVKFLEKWGN